MGYVMHSISAYGLQACRIKASVVVPITPAASINIAFSVYGGAVHTLVPESGTETGRALEAEGVGVVALRLEGPLQPVSQPLQLRLGHLHRGRLRRAYPGSHPTSWAGGTHTLPNMGKTVLVTQQLHIWPQQPHACIRRQLHPL